MMSRLHLAPSPLGALGLCIIATAMLFVSPAHAGIDDIEWTDVHLAFEASVGPGFFDYEADDPNRSFTEPGIAFGVAMGAAFHRRLVVHLRVESLITSTHVPGQPNDVAIVVPELAVRWWAHDWATVELGWGKINYLVDDARFDDLVTLDEGSAFALTLGVPFSRSGRHHHQLFVGAVLGGLDKGDARLFRSGYRWQWR